MDLPDDIQLVRLTYVPTFPYNIPLFFDRGHLLRFGIACGREKEHAFQSWHREVIRPNNGVLRWIENT